MDSQEIPLDADGQEEITHFLDRISSLPKNQQVEMMLSYFSKWLDTLSADELELIHALHIFKGATGRVDQTLDEIFDGHMVLRSLQK